MKTIYGAQARILIEADNKEDAERRVRAGMDKIEGYKQTDDIQIVECRAVMVDLVSQDPNVCDLLCIILFRLGMKTCRHGRTISEAVANADAALAQAEDDANISVCDRGCAEAFLHGAKTCQHGRTRMESMKAIELDLARRRRPTGEN